MSWSCRDLNFISTDTLRLLYPETHSFQPVPGCTLSLVVPRPERNKGGDPLPLVVQAGNWRDTKAWRNLSAVQCDPIVHGIGVDVDAVQKFFATGFGPAHGESVKLRLIMHTSTINERFQRTSSAKRKAKAQMDSGTDEETDIDPEDDRGQQEPEEEEEEEAKTTPKKRGRPKSKASAKTKKKPKHKNKSKDKKETKTKPGQIEQKQHDFSGILTDQSKFLQLANPIQGYQALETDADFYFKTTLRGAEPTWPGSIFTKNGGNCLDRIVLKVFVFLFFAVNSSESVSHT